MDTACRAKKVTLEGVYDETVGEVGHLPHKRSCIVVEARGQTRGVVGGLVVYGGGAGGPRGLLGGF